MRNLLISRGDSYQSKPPEETKLATQTNQVSAYSSDYQSFSNSKIRSPSASVNLRPTSKTRPLCKPGLISALVWQTTPGIQGTVLVARDTSLLTVPVSSMVSTYTGETEHLEYPVTVSIKASITLRKHDIQVFSVMYQRQDIGDD